MSEQHSDQSPAVRPSWWRGARAGAAGGAVVGLVIITATLLNTGTENGATLGAGAANIFQSHFARLGSQGSRV